ncbi:MAG: ABC transporter substrate-binding protein [Candidatus Methylomirabilales bacterium]
MRPPLLATLCVLGLSGFVLPAAEAGVSAGIYRFALGPSDPPSLDPAHITDTVSHSVASEIFDGLVEFDEHLKIRPAIAQSWTISPDGRTYTFTLRKGVRFHNGREVRAEDFRYSFERLLKPETRSERTWILEKLKGARAFMAEQAKRVSGIRVLGPYRLALDLEEPFAPFLALLAYPSASVLPREEVERWGGQFATHPVGTGPFRFVSWRHDDQVVLDAFAQHFRGTPRLERILFRIIPEELVRLEEFRAGNLEHTDIPVGRYRTIQADPELKDRVITSPSFGINAIQLNLEQPPFRDNVALRHALNYAVDKAVVARVIMEGRVEPARGVLPPGMLGHNPDLPGYPYDPNRARRLLAEAGYPGGKGLAPLTLHYNKGLVNRTLCEYIQAALQEIGVRVELRAVDWAAYIQLVDSGQAQMYRLGWLADYPDPENFLTVLFHSRNVGPPGNASRYRNPRVDALLDRADRSLDPGERIRLYREAERLIVDDAPWLFLHYYSTDILLQPYVRDLKEQLTPMDSAPTLGQVRMRSVWLDRR